MAHDGSAAGSYAESTPEDSAAPLPQDTPSATPAPPPPAPTVVEAQHVGQSSEQAATELTQQGILVAFADTSGNALPAVSGWSVVAESPAAGAAVPVGSTVRLTLQPPAPPPPPPAPAPAPDPGAGGATALCNDGTLSFSAHHQGTCSHHGGVAVWYR
ncbi:DUF3761 domain-containing protein [Leifsonia xyli]|uniref:PASTA domain-containing protein n=1 Tax=Leifsonia xyli TaxID=1575 RepID=UPI003D67EDB5